METRGFRALAMGFVTILAVAGVSAQEGADWRSWTSVSFNHRINSGLRVRSKLEYRTKNDFGSSDRWNANVGLHYAVLPRLELKGSYELHHRQTAGGVWRFRHRFNLGTLASWRWGDFRLSWRERLQETLQGDDAECMLRSRLKLDYSVPQTRLQPHFSVEIFQRLDSSFPEIPVVRYRPGVKYGISRRCALVVFYCRQYEKIRKANIAGVDWELYF